jgi:hypothetical protein
LARGRRGRFQDPCRPDGTERIFKVNALQGLNYTPAYNDMREVSHPVLDFCALNLQECKIIILTAFTAWHDSFFNPVVFGDVSLIVDSPMIRRLWPWRGLPC